MILKIGLTQAFRIAYLLVLTLCGTFGSLSLVSAAEINRNTIIAAVPESFPPYFQLNQDAQPEGFAIDVMNKIAEQADFEIEYRAYTTWPSAMAAVQNNDVDLIPNVGITDARREFLIFSSPIETFAVSVFVREETNHLETLDDLRKVTVGVVAGNAAVRLIKDRSLEMRLYDSAADLFLDLVSGNIDAVAYPEPVFWKMANESGLDHKIRKLGQPLVEIKRAIGISKSSNKLAVMDQIDRAVPIYLKSDDYLDTYLKWFPKPKPFWTITRVIWTSLSGLLLIAAALLVWRYVSLQRVNIRLNDAEKTLRETNRDLENKVELRTEALSKANKILKAIDRLRHHHLSEPDPHVMYTALLNEVLDLTGSSFGFIGDVLDDESHKKYLCIYAITNISWDPETNALYEEHKKKGLIFRNLDTLFGHVITSGSYLISNDPALDSRAGGVPKGHPPLESFLGIPIFYGDTLVGELGLANRHGGFDKKLVSVLEPITSALGEIINSRWNIEARKKSEAELKALASTDYLTGIANRRTLIERLRLEKKNVARYGNDLSLVMFDLDNFKQVNDTFGHDVGDQVLINVVKLAQESVREVDLIARWGGEEFVVLLPQTSSSEAYEIAERFRKKVEHFALEQPPALTISLGITSMRDDDDDQTIVSRADKALYKAKNNGRNCTIELA